MNHIYLIIEFLDELVFGVGETAWPFLRDDLHLTYTQIGLLLSLPGMVAAFIEPFIGILGEIWKHRCQPVQHWLVSNFAGTVILKPARAKRERHGA